MFRVILCVLLAAYVNPLLGQDTGGNELYDGWILASYADGTPIPGLAASRNEPNEVVEDEGTAAAAGQQLSIVSIQVVHEGKSYHICGGTLVGARAVLTSASCLIKFDSLPHQVALGYFQLSLGTDNPGSQLIDASRVIRHKKYDWTSDDIRNNLAILILEKPAVLSDTVDTVELSYLMPGMAVGEEAVLIGWGLSNVMDSNVTADILQEAHFMIMSRNKCKASVSGVRLQNLCVEATSLGACHGYGGNPLMLYQSSDQVGVASYNKGCDGDDATVFTSTAYFSTWLLNHLPYY